ncbi:MAG: SusC/RagA family TonB-linked outer membrane protein, partial [Gemmatimonadaceae bacterium]|nr:SusC/RagA family TonB-linked outer membrane protein [Gemmatimonadaceae bacterium]
TNAAGQYTILNVPSGARQVAARRIGFARRTAEVTVVAGQPVAVDFTLSMAATQLNEVVVTGTGGAVERKTLGNSITTLDVADLAQKSTVQNVTEVLQGKTPGVTILPGSGAPGTGGEIRIRGAGSLSGYSPVVYIDGIRYDISSIGSFSASGGGTAGLAQSSQTTSALNNLNPNDIESIEVIKGPAAATLYGAEAANGVIQIITKKGARGQQQVRWTFSGERGQSEWTRLPEDNYTTCDAVKRAQVVASTGEPLWPGCVGVAENAVITDNPIARDPRAIRVGQFAKASMSVRGGGDQYSFYVSGDRDTEQGVFFNSDNSRTSIRSNIGFNPNTKADFQINVNYINGRLRLPIQDESANGILISARRGLPGRVSALGEGNEGWRLISPTAANRYKNYTETERITLGGTLNYEPFPWLRNRATIGFDNQTNQAQLLFLPGDIDTSQDPDAASGANLRRTPTQRVLTMDYAGTVPYALTPSIETTTQFGAQVVANQSETLSATGIGIGAPDVTLINLLQRSTGAESYSENNSVGYYLQEQVAWNNRLFVTGAVRADDHSSFGTNFDFIIYPKLSVSYVVSEEPALTGFLDAARINSLKLRGAWGQAGRAPSAYSAPQTYTVDRVTLGTTTGSAIRTAAFGNPDLKPERGEELELGFDMSLLDERMGVDFTVYDKVTSDMLQAISVAPSTGFISTRLTNLGEVSNRGLELAVWGTPVRTRGVSWDARLSLSTNRNRLESFGVAGKTEENPGGQAYGVVQQHREGYPLGGFWVTEPLRCGIDDTPTGATIMPCGPRGSAMRTAAGVALFSTDRRYQGPSTPTREFGFSNTVTLFGNVRLYALLDHKGGFKVFNLQERNRCQTANDNCARVNDPRARFPQTDADSVLFHELAVYRSTAVSPEWIQAGDFVKLRELSLSYNVPTRFVQRAGGQTATLMLAARNLAIWSDYEGADPEVNSYGGRNFVRVDAYASPAPRRMTASVNFTY